MFRVACHDRQSGFAVEYIWISQLVLPCTLYKNLDIIQIHTGYEKILEAGLQENIFVG